MKMNSLNEPITVTCYVMDTSISYTGNKLDTLQNFCIQVLKFHKTMYPMMRMNKYEVLSAVNASNYRLLRLNSRVRDQLHTNDIIYIVTEYDWKIYVTSILSQMESPMRHGKVLTPRHPNALSHDQLRDYVTMYICKKRGPINETSSITDETPIKYDTDTASMSKATAEGSNVSIISPNVLEPMDQVASPSNNGNRIRLTIKDLLASPESHDGNRSDLNDNSVLSVNWMVNGEMSESPTQRLNLQSLLDEDINITTLSKADSNKSPYIITSPAEMPSVVHSDHDSFKASITANIEDDEVPPPPDAVPSDDQISNDITSQDLGSPLKDVQSASILPILSNSLDTLSLDHSEGIYRASSSTIDRGSSSSDDIDDNDEDDNISIRIPSLSVANASRRKFSHDFGPASFSTGVTSPVAGNIISNTNDWSPRTFESKFPPLFFLSPLASPINSADDRGNASPKVFRSPRSSPLLPSTPRDSLTPRSSNNNSVSKAESRSQAYLPPTGANPSSTANNLMTFFGSTVNPLSNLQYGTKAHPLVEKISARQGIPPSSPARSSRPSSPSMALPVTVSQETVQTRTLGISLISESGDRVDVHDMDQEEKINDIESVPSPKSEIMSEIVKEGDREGNGLESVHSSNQTTITTDPGDETFIDKSIDDPANPREESFEQQAMSDHHAEDEKVPLCHPFLGEGKDKTINHVISRLNSYAISSTGASFALSACSDEYTISDDELLSLSPQKESSLQSSLSNRPDSTPDKLTDKEIPSIRPPISPICVPDPIDCNNGIASKTMLLAFEESSQITFQKDKTHDFIENVSIIQENSSSKNVIRDVKEDIAYEIEDSDDGDEMGRYPSIPTPSSHERLDLRPIHCDHRVGDDNSKPSIDSDSVRDHDIDYPMTPMPSSQDKLNHRPVHRSRGENNINLMQSKLSKDFDSVREDNHDDVQTADYIDPRALALDPKEISSSPQDSYSQAKDIIQIYADAQDKSFDSNMNQPSTIITNDTSNDQSDSDIGTRSDPHPMERTNKPLHSPNLTNIDTNHEEDYLIHSHTRDVAESNAITPLELYYLPFLVPGYSSIHDLSANAASNIAAVTNIIMNSPKCSVTNPKWFATPTSKGVSNISAFTMGSSGQSHVFPVSSLMYSDNSLALQRLRAWITKYTYKHNFVDPLMWSMFNTFGNVDGLLVKTIK